CDMRNALAFGSHLPLMNSLPPPAATVDGSNVIEPVCALAVGASIRTTALTDTNPTANIHRRTAALPASRCGAMRTTASTEVSRALPDTPANPTTLSHRSRSSRCSPYHLRMPGRGATKRRTLTREQARRIAIRAQLLDADRPRDLLAVVDRLTFLQ